MASTAKDARSVWLGHEEGIDGASKKGKGREVFKPVDEIKKINRESKVTSTSQINQSSIETRKR